MTLEVRYDGRQFLIDVPGGQPVPAINEWPGWRRTPSGTYFAPPWTSSVISMTKLAQPLRWTQEAAKKRDELLGDLQGARNALANTTVKPDGIFKFPTERRPKMHQWQAVRALGYMRWRALLADDMGLGKTSTALWSVLDAQVQRILVICPVSVKFNWQNEITTTLGPEWASWVIDGSSKKRAGQLVEAWQARNTSKVAIIINYDLLRHLSDDQMAQLLAFVSEGMLFCDESHYCKSRTSDRTELTTKLAMRARYVIAMTGTPIRNLAEDLFAQVNIVRPGTWTSFHDFAKRHLVIQSVKFGKREVQKTVGTRNLDALNAVMNTLQIKRSKSEVIDLPPKIHTFPELQLEGEMLRIYKAMKEFAKIELQAIADAKMSVFDPRAKSAVEQAMRCEQIAQGFIGGIPDPLMAKLGDDILKLAEKIPGRPNELIFPSSPKIVWLLEAIESVLRQGGSPIVFSRFNAPMVWLQGELAKRGELAGMLHGGLSSVERQDTINKFMGKTNRVLIAQVKIAEGWNAPVSQDVLFLGRDWSPAINAQAEDRAHRMGQKGTVNVQVPIVRNSIELMIHRRLVAKGADAEQALRTVTIEELMEAL